MASISCSDESARVGPRARSRSAARASPSSRTPAPTSAPPTARRGSRWRVAIKRPRWSRSAACAWGSSRRTARCSGSTTAPRGRRSSVPSNTRARSRSRTPYFRLADSDPWTTITTNGATGVAIAGGGRCHTDPVTGAFVCDYN